MSNHATARDTKELSSIAIIL